MFGNNFRLVEYACFLQDKRILRPEVVEWDPAGGINLNVKETRDRLRPLTTSNLAKCTLPYPVVRILWLKPNIPSQLCTLNSNRELRTIKVWPFWNQMMKNWRTFDTSEYSVWWKPTSGTTRTFFLADHLSSKNCFTKIGEIGPRWRRFKTREKIFNFFGSMFRQY